jgi:hypothetical protein
MTTPSTTTLSVAATENLPDASFDSLLTSKLGDQQVWADLMAAFDQVMQVNVDGPIQQLEQLRYLPPDAEQSLLAETCRMLGFDLSQDILNMSVDRFTRIATQLGMYPDSNGTEQFVNFISLMINGQCEITPLYTKDYVNFTDVPEGPLITEGGEWFKTTHVWLDISFSTLTGLILKPGESLYSKILEIFYAQDPIALVVDKTALSVTVPCDIGFQVSMLPSEHVFTLE